MTTSIGFARTNAVGSNVERLHNDDPLLSSSSHMMQRFLSEKAIDSALRWFYNSESLCGALCTVAAAGVLSYGCEEKDLDCACIHRTRTEPTIRSHGRKKTRNPKKQISQGSRRKKFPRDTRDLGHAMWRSGIELRGGVDGRSDVEKLSDVRREVKSHGTRSENLRLDEQPSATDNPSDVVALTLNKVGDEVEHGSTGPIVNFRDDIPTFLKSESSFAGTSPKIDNSQEQEALSSSPGTGSIEWNSTSGSVITNDGGDEC